MVATANFKATSESNLNLYSTVMIPTYTEHYIPGQLTLPGQIYQDSYHYLDILDPQEPTRTVKATWRNDQC